MILPFSGSMLFLHYEKGRAKRHMLEIVQKVNSGQLLELTFTIQEYESLHWEHDYEFSLKGEMYDVLSKEIQNDVIIVKCVHDKRETSINKSIVKFIAGFLNSNPFHEQQLMAFTDFAKHLAPIISIKPNIISIFITILNDYQISFPPHIGFSEPSIPPPEHS